MEGLFRRCQGYYGMFRVYVVSETTQFELKSGRG